MPWLGTTTTTVLPRMSGRAATSSAYLIAAPELGPTIMPSRAVTWRAMATASAADTWPNSSTMPRGASVSAAGGSP